MKSRTSRKRIVAYVESYDDVLFWRMVLDAFEDETRYFEVMLPSRSTLCKGKKQALMSLMENGGGHDMIACVDADYDYLMQGKSYESEFMLSNPYVIHTYAYAIENLQCYAPSLHGVSVMVTLNDRRSFDFVDFLSEYSRIIFPLFVWNIMMYRNRDYGRFSITEFNSIVSIRHSRPADYQTSLNKLRNKVHLKINELRKKCPGKKEEYLAVKDSLLHLGVTPETTYLFIQGHHLFDTIVVPLMHNICDQLRYERERDIKTKAVHTIQMQNELSAYQKAQSDIPNMLKKNFAYFSCPLYRRIIADVEKLLNN